jgi:hypothetical protein
MGRTPGNSWIEHCRLFARGTQKSSGAAQHFVYGLLVQLARFAVGVRYESQNADNFQIRYNFFVL